jgi:hypothetical protein
LITPVSPGNSWAIVCHNSPRKKEELVGFGGSWQLLLWLLSLPLEKRRRLGYWADISVI